MYLYVPILPYGRRLVSGSYSNHHSCLIPVSLNHVAFHLNPGVLVVDRTVLVCSMSPSIAPGFTLSALRLCTKDPHLSDLLSQTSQNAVQSLELQLYTSRKVLELTKNVRIMTASASEALRVSTQIAEILELVSTFQSSGGSIQRISDDVKTLNLRSQGRRSNIFQEAKTVTEDKSYRSQRDPDP